MYPAKFKLFLRISFCIVLFGVAQSARAQIVGQGETLFALIRPGDPNEFELTIRPRGPPCQAARRCVVSVVTKLQSENGIERFVGPGDIDGNRLKYVHKNGQSYEMVASADGCVLRDVSRPGAAIKKAPACLERAGSEVPSGQTPTKALPAVGVFPVKNRPSVSRFESKSGGGDGAFDSAATLKLARNQVDAWNEDVATRLLNVIGNMMRGDTSQALVAIRETDRQAPHERVNGRLWFLESYSQKLRERANP
jgi:hypothetical protein